MTTFIARGLLNPPSGVDDFLSGGVISRAVEESQPPEFIAQNTETWWVTTGPPGGLTVAWPSHQVDDVGILLVAVFASGDVPTLQTPAGFVEFGSIDYGGGWAYLKAFWCRATSGSMTAPVVEDSTNGTIASLSVVRGAASTGVPVEAVATDTNNAIAGVPWTFPGGSTTQPNTLIYLAGAQGPAEDSIPEGYTNAALTDITPRNYTEVSDAGTDGMYYATAIKATAGAVGTTSVTMPTSGQRALMSFAVRSAPSNWSVDATSGKGVPANATEWGELITAESLTNWSAPTSLYLCQEASSPLDDAIGAFDLTASGASNLYQQSVSGWSRLAVKLTDGATPGNWNSTSSSLPDMSTTSCLLLAYVAMPGTAPAATRNFIILGATATPGVVIRLLSTGTLQVTSGTAVASANILGYVGPIVAMVDQTNNIVRVYTLTEKFTPTLSGTASGKALYLGSPNASPNVGFLYAARWDGAIAERSEQDVADLFHALGWPLSWSVDATSGIGVPANDMEWANLAAVEELSVGLPSHLYLMQEASGNLSDSIGSLTFSASGTPSYSNAVSGWSRSAIGTSDGTSGAFTNTTNPPTAISTSMAMLGYIRIDTTATERQFMMINGTSSHLVQVNVTGAGLLRYYVETGNVLGTVNYEGGSVVPILMVYDRTNSRAIIYTNEEKITATYAAVSAGSTKRWCGTSPPTALYLYGAIWTGAAAETLSTDANAKALLEALGWTVTGY